MVYAKARGCGSRKVGGIYLTVPLAKEGGATIESLLVDPPSVIDPNRVGLSAIGVQTIERGGVSHVLDWVGSENYPNVADFVEEARRMGISRRISKTFDFYKLTPKSRLFLVHQRAYVQNSKAYYEAYQDERGEPVVWKCPKFIPHHQHPASQTELFGKVLDYVECCAGVWWHDIDGGEAVLDPAFPYRSVERTVGSTTYFGLRRPDCFDKEGPEYLPAVFMSVGIPKIEVIRDPKDGTHQEAVDLASKAFIDVEVVDS